MLLLSSELELLCTHCVEATDSAPTEDLLLPKHSLFSKRYNFEITIDSFKLYFEVVRAQQQALVESTSDS